MTRRFAMPLLKVQWAKKAIDLRRNAADGTTLTPSLTRAIPACILLLSGLVFVSINYGRQAMLFTAAYAAAIYMVYLLLKRRRRLRIGLAYAAFFSTSVLTAAGQINPLTGFNGGGGPNYWFGISFASAALSIFIYEKQLSLRLLLLNILQPLRLYSGPCPIPKASPVTEFSQRRLLFYGAWLNLGLLFHFALAPALSVFFPLKASLNPLDTLVFSVAYEFYVYFNFAGISFIVYAILNLSGLACVLNFNSPFAARNIIDYWQRWHIALSQICKVLFFIPLKKIIGIYGAVLAVFLSSALWHGVSINFFMWGTFHAIGWMLSYWVIKTVRFGNMLAWLMLPFIVVIGRLLFSELDTHLLLHKLHNLYMLNYSMPLALKRLSLGRSNIVLLTVAFLIIASEVSGHRQFIGYRIYRKGWNSILILILALLYGAEGMGGIYGAR